MKHCADQIAEDLAEVREILLWELADRLQQHRPPLLLGIREPHQSDAPHIAGSNSVPCGGLEAACDGDCGDTVPRLSGRHECGIVVLCRSGNRSMRADTRPCPGCLQAFSLRTGVRGGNDFEQTLVDRAGATRGPRPGRSHASARRSSCVKVWP